jgi:hypothetical protein
MRRHRQGVWALADAGSGFETFSAAVRQANDRSRWPSRLWILSAPASCPQARSLTIGRTLARPAPTRDAPGLIADSRATMAKQQAACEVDQPVSGRVRGLQLMKAPSLCKIADDSLPRFESWTCHPFSQVGPGENRVRPREGALPNTVRAAYAYAKTALPPAGRHPVIGRDARTPGLACRRPEGGELQEQVAVPNTRRRILPCIGYRGRDMRADDPRGQGGVLLRMCLAHRVITSADSGACRTRIVHVSPDRPGRRLGAGPEGAAAL